MILEQIAEELVEVTSALIRGRTINVMNLEGIIIASSERERIGTFHQGAMQVIRTGRTVNITKEQSSRYSGAKEGRNMPIRRNGKIIGVVGIYGNPDMLQDLAHLLEVYTAKYLELETIVRQKMEETEIRKKLFHLLMDTEGENQEYRMTLMDDLSLRMEFPMQVLIFSNRESGKLSSVEILEILQNKQYLDSQRDLYLEEDGHLVLVKSRVLEKMERLYQKMYEAVYEDGCALRMSLGSICETWEDIKVSYQEARVLDVCGEKCINRISDPAARCSFIMYLAAMEQETYIKTMYKRLTANVREEELSVLLTSAECYYKQGRSVSKAAKQLFIHKNTLQYRLRRLLEAMELTGENGFYQEFLVRLILQYMRR